jgi:DNA-binding transcriptional LysR family regulator
MTMTQLRAFLAAYALGSFTAASTQLGTSQAAVSELIGRLEEEVGLSLFTRGVRGLIPTTAAVELRDHAQRSVTSFDNGIEALHSIASMEGGVCTFGVLRNARYYGLSDLAQRFHRRYPAVKLRLVGLNSALIAESVARGQVEAALVVLPVAEAGLLVTPLFQDEVVYASATRDVAKGPMTIEEMATARLVLYDAYAGWADPTRRQIRERAQLRGLRIDPIMEVEHVESALSLVSDQAADTIVCKAVTADPAFPHNVSTTAFVDPIFDTVALIQREGSYLSPATLKIVELIKRTVRENTIPSTPQPEWRSATTIPRGYFV